MPQTKEQRRSAIVENEVGEALRLIDQRILNDGTREKLEVNRPGRIVPHYRFMPSLLHPEPWGIASYNERMVHKRVGKKSGSRRK